MVAIKVAWPERDDCARLCDDRAMHSDPRARTRSFAAWILSLFVITHVVAAEPVNVRVTHIVSDRFPAMSDADVDKVLHIAGEMIRNGYGREVRFVPAEAAT